MPRRSISALRRPRLTAALLAAVAVSPIAAPAPAQAVHRPPPPTASDVPSRVDRRLDSFERRRATGRGAFVTRAELERRSAARLGDILREIPGVVIVSVPGGGRAVAASRPALRRRRTDPFAVDACYFDVLLDGVPLTPSSSVLPVDIDDISPRSLMGVEVHRASSIPLDLSVGVGSCGVVALWSRMP